MHKSVDDMIKERKYVLLKFNNLEKYVIINRDYLNFLESYCKNSDNLFIIKGTQIFKCIDPVHFKDKPIIIIRTSTITSLIRRLKRHLDFKTREFSGEFAHLKKLLNDSKLLHWIDTKVLNKFIKELKKEVIS